MALRWGIVSAGFISQDFVTAVQVLPPSDHQVVAIGARSLASAQKFAERFKIPTAYEGYQKLAEDPNIDVIYIGNLNPQHYEVSKLMLEHGKHVLCEKPLTLNEKQTRALVKIAKEKKVFLMEAVWSRCFPVYQELTKLLNAGTIGDIVHISAAFGFAIQNVDRLKSKDLGGGTILDLGVYVLQFAQFIVNSETPKNVVAVGGLNNDGVDVYTSSLWTYSNDKIASLHTSAKVELPNEAIVVGTKGTIKVPQFWCPTKLIVSGETKEFPLPKTNVTTNFSNSVGLSYEAEHVRQCIKAGKIESPLISHEQSVQLAHHMDTLRKQLGVVYAEDALDY